MKLKQFSLSSFKCTFFYDEMILPLLRRMINLEELTLYLSIIRFHLKYVDGIQLHDDILRHMPRLNKFVFNIDTAVVKYASEFILPSHEDIQRGFLERGFVPIGSHVELFLKEKGDAFGHSPSKFYSRCQIFSLPYQFPLFSFLSNSFQSRTFDKVRTVVMMDIRPFEHEFFQLIAQSFPLLRSLAISNEEPQKDKQQSRTLITFPELLCLDLRKCHRDYVEQFLVDHYCCLPRLVTLGVKFVKLLSATKGFKNDSTRLTCSRVKHLLVDRKFIRSDRFPGYFPSL